VHDSRGNEIVNFTISLALSAGTLMASAGTSYRLVPAHFYPCAQVCSPKVPLLVEDTGSHNLVPMGPRFDDPSGISTGSSISQDLLTLVTNRQTDCGTSVTSASSYAGRSAALIPEDKCRIERRCSVKLIVFKRPTHAVRYTDAV